MYYVQNISEDASSSSNSDIYHNIMIRTLKHYFFNILRLSRQSYRRSCWTRYRKCERLPARGTIWPQTTPSAYSIAKSTFPNFISRNRYQWIGTVTWLPGTVPGANPWWLLLGLKVSFFPRRFSIKASALTVCCKKTNYLNPDVTVVTLYNQWKANRV
jgi:hypothetical protein